MSTRYRFTVEMTGIGETPEEAWDDAVESFVGDPGEPSATEVDSDQEGFGQ